MTEPLSLGELIDRLSIIDPTRKVEFDFCGVVPTNISSSRGDYSHPALGWAPSGYSGPGKAPSVGELVEALRKGIGAPYEGWKGGTYYYTRPSPLWVDNRGDWSATRIVGVETDGSYVVLVTERRNDH